MSKQGEAHQLAASWWREWDSRRPISPLYDEHFVAGKLRPMLESHATLQAERAELIETLGQLAAAADHCCSVLGLEDSIPRLEQDAELAHTLLAKLRGAGA